MGGVEGVCRTWGQRGLCMARALDLVLTWLVRRLRWLLAGDAGLGLGRVIMALCGVGQLGCEGGGLGRAGVVMLVRGRGEAQVGIFGLFCAYAPTGHAVTL